MMWTDYFSNGRAAIEAFKNDVPELGELRLEQLVFEADSVSLALDLESLPATIPDRWREKHYDALQLRLLFATRELEVRRDSSRVAGPDKVTVEVEEDRLRVFSTTASFDLTASFFSARLELFPYRRADGEFPPRWFRIV